MKLLWTGSWPWWLVIPLALMLIGFSVWVYQRQRVSRPLNRILPVLRGIAIFLLMLSLLQPVLARFFTEVKRGEVLVLVDNSGSMSVADRYEPARAIEVAWHLGRFPGKLRYTGFLDEDRMQEWAEIFVPLKNEPVRLRDLTLAADGVQEWREDLQAEIDAVAYLKGEAFTEWNAWLEQASALETSLRSEVERVEAAKKEDRDLLPRIPDATVWMELGESFSALQEAADNRLAEAGVSEVDEALKALEETSREELVRDIWEGNEVGLFQQLEDRGEVKLFGLDSGEQAMPEPALESLEEGHAASRLGSALRDAVKGRGDAPLSGVVLISDGNQNAGMTLGQFGEWVEGRNIPLVALGIGETEPREDLVVERVIAPETAFVDDRLSMRVRVSRVGFTDQPLALKVMHGEEEVHRQTIEPGEVDRLWVDVGFVETEKGERDYLVELEPQEEEWLERNNSRSVQVNVLDDPIRILLVDAWPRWETRYLDMMLHRDPRVECQTIFYGSSESGTLRTGEDQYPQDREELFGFEVVVLGDVNPDQFSRGQLEDLHAFVEERGGTLIWVAGSRYMPTAYTATPLWDLAPFRLDPEIGDAEKDGTDAFRVTLTETGKHDPMAVISNSDETSRRLWSELPALPWVRTGITALPLADRTAETVEGQTPVLIKSYRGLGKLVYIGSDSFWRWRDRARWTYHQRLWGQIILWSALGRTSGSDRYVKLMTDRLRYGNGEEVTVRARLLDEEGRPITEADAFVNVFDERLELVRKLHLRELAGGGGSYEASLTGLPEGAYTAKPEVFELRGLSVQAEIGFRIGELPTSEYVRLAYDEGALTDATEHVARVWNPEEALEVLEPAAEERIRREDLEIWNHPLYLLLAVGLLSAEWGLRRRNRYP